MARSRLPIKKASRALLDALSEIEVGCNKEVARSIRDVANDAKNVARDTLERTYHTQKWGNELKKQIGINYKDGIATIFAPKEDTAEMRAQMYYAEYGTGYNSSGWWYRSTKHDKNPTVKRVKGSGDLIAFTRKSHPVGYMRAARRYLLQNANKRVEQAIRLVLTRKPISRRREMDEDEEFDE